MGNWHISIRGVGHHHNANVPTDANRLAAGFVKTLQDNGHSVTSAAITHGGEDNLLHPFPGSAEPTPLAIDAASGPLVDETGG